MRTAILGILTCLILVGKASTQERFEVFFLAVGSSSYVVPVAEDVKGLPNVNGAANSARIVANLLKQGGSTFGVTLVSDQGRFVSRENFDQALVRVWEEIENRKPRQPLLVFYFAGHGMADGLTWFQLLPMGDFAYRGDLQSLVEGLSSELEKNTVNVTGLVFALRRLSIPFLVLLDTCYEGRAQNFLWKPLPDAGCAPDDMICSAIKKRVEPLREFDRQMQEVAKGFNELAASFRKTNRFEDTYPVIFSTIPGNRVSTVADPYDADTKATPVGPLARRAMLIVSPMLESRQRLSLKSFISLMISPTLDQATGPGVMYAQMPANSELILFGAEARGGTIESRIGTATTPVICCGNAP